MGTFDMLFLVLKANYGEKISLLQIFSLLNTNAPGLMCSICLPFCCINELDILTLQEKRVSGHAHRRMASSSWRRGVAEWRNIEHKK